MVDLECVGAVPLFEGLTEEEYAALAQRMELLTCEKGENILGEGEDNEKLYLIKSGVIRLVEKVQGQNRQTMAILRSPEFFGEVSLLDGKAAMATAEVMKDAQLLVIRRDDFEAFWESCPRGGYKVLRRLAASVCHNLRHMDDEFIDVVKYVWEMGAKM